MIPLNIISFRGAAPLYFGIQRSDVHRLLGTPRLTHRGIDSWGTMMEINISYNVQNQLHELGLGPGNYELTFDGQILWNSNSHPDPNPLLLTKDQNPVECVGFLVFQSLGIITSGYHDDDPGQFAIKLYQQGAWDELLRNSKKPMLEKYRTMNLGDKNGS